MALTKNSQPVYDIGEICEAPLASGAKPFLGSMLGYTGNNTVRPLVAGDKFAGFSIDQYDQTGTDVNARFKHEGYVVVTVTGLAANTAVGTSVYASDDNTCTLTSAGNSLMGKVHRLAGGGKAVVEFDATKF